MTETKLTIESELGLSFKPEFTPSYPLETHPKSGLTLCHNTAYDVGRVYMAIMNQELFDFINSVTSESEVEIPSNFWTTNGTLLLLGYLQTRISPLLTFHYKDGRLIRFDMWKGVATWNLLITPRVTDVNNTDTSTSTDTDYKVLGYKNTIVEIIYHLKSSKKDLKKIIESIIARVDIISRVTINKFNW